MEPSASVIGSIECPACAGTGFIQSPHILRVADEVKRLFAPGLPTPDPTKGQFFFSPSGVASIVAFMLSKGDIEGRHIACLGTPTVAAGLAVLGAARRVVALDLDKELLDYIKSQTEGSRLETAVYDIKDEVPPGLRGVFDCFAIDPVYAVDHCRLSISRALDLVGPQPYRSGYIAVPPKQVTRHWEDGCDVPLSFAVMRLLMESRVHIVEVRPGLAEYSASPGETTLYRGRFGRDLPLPFADYSEPWRSSSVVRVETLEGTKALAPSVGTPEIPVTTGPRRGRDLAFVRLPAGSRTETRCCLCPECYQEAGLPSPYVPPRFVNIRVPSWGLKAEQLPSESDECLAFYNIAEPTVVVLQGPTSRVIYDALETLAKEQPEPPSFHQIKDVVAAVLARYKLDSVNKDQQYRKAVRFAVQLVDGGLFDWKRMAR